MKTKFRISRNDIIKATLTVNGQLVASIYDSQFTTKDEVFHALCNKTSYKGLKAECHISIADKMKSISFYKTVK